MLCAAEIPIWAQILLSEPDRKNVLTHERFDVVNAKSCLVLLAHGSKDPRWRQSFESLFLNVRRHSKRVQLAYMEFAGPTLFEVAEQCALDGVTAMQILPMFMASGAHLATDVPEQVEQLKARFPGLHIEVLQPIGEDPRVISLMKHMILEVVERL